MLTCAVCGEEDDEENLYWLTIDEGVHVQCLVEEQRGVGA